MYNSFIVRLFVGAGNVFSLAYQDSFLKSIVNVFKRCISYLTNGSVTINLFIKSYKVIENSATYRLFTKALNFISRIFKSLKGWFKSFGQGSIAYNSIKKLFRTNIAVIISISVFILTLAIGIIISNLTRGLFSGRSYIGSIILILASVIVISRGERLKDLLEGSFVYRFIRDIFVIDEGGEQWW